MAQSSLNPCGAELRKQIRDKRRAISAPLQQSLSLQACERALTLPEILHAKHIALYLSQDGELNTAPLIHALWQRGIATYLPRFHPFCSGHLLFLRYDANTRLSANRYGILEPELILSHVKPIYSLDIIITPLVAFDSKGQRMGMGGGYYDRTLAHWSASGRPLPVGYAHDCQQLPALNPQPWDVSLPYVITPTQLIVNH